MSLLLSSNEMTDSFECFVFMVQLKEILFIIYIHFRSPCVVHHDSDQTDKENNERSLFSLQNNIWNVFGDVACIWSGASKIKSLAFEMEWFDHDSYEKHALLLVLCKYCSGPKCQLRKLKFNVEPDVSVQWTNLLKPIFKRLNDLCLHRCAVDLLSSCDSLIELELNYCKAMTPFAGISAKKFSQLKKLSIHFCHWFSDFLRITQPNVTLKCFEYTGHNGILIVDIACKFPNLEEFQCFHGDRFAEDQLLLPLAEKSLHPWKQMKKIGFSDFTNRYRSQNFVNRLIEARTPVEWLILLYGDIDDYSVLAKLTELKTLEIVERQMIGRIQSGYHPEHC